MIEFLNGQVERISYMYVDMALLGVAVAPCAHCVCVLGEFGGMLPQKNLGVLDINSESISGALGGGKNKTAEYLAIENGTTVSMTE